MYYVNENVKDLYRVKCTDDRSNVLRLDMNENPIGLPKEFVEKVKEKITPELLATYPTKKELISIIAKHNELNDENITVTAGSEEAMRLIFQCFGQQGCSLLTVMPTFEMYDVYSKMFGMNHETVQFEEDFSVSVEKILEKINDNTGIIVLLNPNSPIGTVYSETEFEKIIERANEVDAIVVVDEAYHYFYPSTEIGLTKKYKNLVVLRTFSKLCSMAGLRIGYAAADAKIIEYIEKAESTFNVSNVSVLFATEILKNLKLMEDLVEIEKTGHTWIAERLKANGYKVFSGEGNYVLFYPNHASEELVNNLKAKEIWVRDYKSGILKGWVRISTGDISAMKRVWREIEILDKRN